VPDEPVERRRIGPVGLERDDRKAVPFDQPPGDRGPCAIIFVRAVTCLAEEDDPGVGIAVEMGREARIVYVGQRLGRIGDHFRNASSHQPLAGLVSETMLADQRHEAHRAKIFMLEAPILTLGRLDQVLDRPRIPQRHDDPAADLQLVDQHLRHMAAAGRGDDRVERRLGGAAARAVALEAAQARHAARWRPPPVRSGR
jgi:hypothetical protein